MYSRYMQNSGFFEPEYEQPFTYAHQRREFEERQRELPPPPQQSAREEERPKRERAQKKEREPKREPRREREREPRHRRNKSALSLLGGKGGLLGNLDLDAGDILLILLLFYLYQESGDAEFLILLALLFLG